MLSQIEWATVLISVQGAKYVVRFMEKGKGIDTGYLAHPS
jgi:hypothetical protein